jgi:hypothetical protein
MVKRKQTAHRSKLRQEREFVLRNKLKQKQKKKFNEELFDLVKSENIDSLDLKSKKEVIIKLFNLIISFPNENYDKIKLLIIFLQDKNIKIVLKTMRLLTKLFIDILPSYKIREDLDEKNNSGAGKNKQVSKEVEKVQTLERNLIKFYEKFLNVLEIFAKTPIPNINKPNNDNNDTKNENNVFQILQEFSFQILGELLKKFYLFNFADKIYRVMIECLTETPLNISAEPKIKAFSALSLVLSIQDNTGNMLQLKLDIIKLISHYVFIRPHENFPENILDLFLSHRIDFPDLTAARKADEEKYNLKDIKFGTKEKNSLMSENKHKTKQQERIERREKKKLILEKDKIVKNMRKEMTEYENQENPRQIYNFNLKMLKKILLVYLDILKYKQESPLIKSVLHGIGQLCENINVEILLDIQKVIHDYVINLLSKTFNKDKFKKNEEKKLFAITGIKTIILISVKLTKDIINMEDTRLINSTYVFLQETLELTSKISVDEAFTIMEVLELLFIKNRQYSLDTVGSFIKRIAIFINAFKEVNKKSEKFVSSFLLILKRIVQRYPNLNGLLLNDEDLFDYKMPDPAIANGKQTNIYKEVNSVKNRFEKYSKIVRQLCEYILNAEKINPIFQSMNFYEMLINK